MGCFTPKLGALGMGQPSIHPRAGCLWGGLLYPVCNAPAQRWLHVSSLLYCAVNISPQRWLSFSCLLYLAVNVAPQPAASRLSVILGCYCFTPDMVVCISGFCSTQPLMLPPEPAAFGGGPCYTLQHLYCRACCISALCYTWLSLLYPRGGCISAACYTWLLMLHPRASHSGDWFTQCLPRRQLSLAVPVIHSAAPPHPLQSHLHLSTLLYLATPDAPQPKTAAFGGSCYTQAPEPSLHRWLNLSCWLYWAVNASPHRWLHVRSLLYAAPYAPLQSQLPLGVLGIFSPQHPTPEIIAFKVLVITSLKHVPPQRQLGCQCFIPEVAVFLLLVIPGC